MALDDSSTERIPFFPGKPAANKVLIREDTVVEARSATSEDGSTALTGLEMAGLVGESTWPRKP